MELLHLNKTLVKTLKKSPLIPFKKGAQAPEEVSRHPESFFKHDIYYGDQIVRNTVKFNFVIC
jgi:hypothetical protein